ncbi:hypothetical protein B7P43_G14700, partial [Cryptotermes secundus]
VCVSLFLSVPSVICLQCPTSQEEWKKVSKEFEDRWQFPNCIGAMDGKHVAITPPPGTGSFFFNYKYFHSQVLFGVANTNYELLFFSLGSNGRNFLRSKIQNQYTPLECLDDEDFETGNVTPGYRCSQFMDLERRQQFFPTQDAKLVGELFLEYFNNEGKLPWQDMFCF